MENPKEIIGRFLFSFGFQTTASQEAKPRYLAQYPQSFTGQN